MANVKTTTNRQPATDRILKKMERAGVMRTRELVGRGIHRAHLQRLEERGLIQRAGRGLYRLADAELSEHDSFLEAAKLVPQGILCLLSALNFHNLTTQDPFEVWMAIGRGAHRPRVSSPPLRIHHFSGPALTEGVEEHQIEGVTVRVYNVAKTGWRTASNSATRSGWTWRSKPCANGARRLTRSSITPKSAASPT